MPVYHNAFFFMFTPLLFHECPRAHCQYTRHKHRTFKPKNIMAESFYRLSSLSPEVISVYVTLLFSLQISSALTDLVHIHVYGLS